MPDRQPLAADLDHVAVALERWEDGFPLYGGALAGEWVAGGGAPGFASCQLRYLSGMKVELLAPRDVDQNDFLRRFIDASGVGPHHLTFKVPSWEEAVEHVQAAGYHPVGVNGSEPDWKELFIHPKEVPGVVVQLAEAHGTWETPPPDGFPTPRTDRPADLVHVAHAVADLDQALSLFRDVLGGRPVREGSADDGGAGSAGGCFVDVAWPGPGRIRLLTPSQAGDEVDRWLGGRPGRVHHVAFAGDRPDEVVDAVRQADGTLVVEPPHALGTRLLLAADPGALTGA